MTIPARIPYRSTGAQYLVVFAMLIVACSPTPKPESASLVITGARVWTGDPDQPWAEAVAATGEDLIAVGSSADIAPLIGDDTEVIAADGGMLVPGFIDTHVHFLSGGSSIASVQLRDAKSPQEFTQRIANFAGNAEPGEWITGGTWDHTNWGGELPRREWIDSVTPDNPVWVARLDGHMALANSVALDLAGVDADTPDVTGGEIIRDAQSRPTGILKDNAMRLVHKVMPEPTESQLDRYLDAAMRYVAENGVTTVHDMFADDFDSWLSLATYRRAEANAALITRIYSVTPLVEWQKLSEDIAVHGRGSEWLKTGGVKGFMDGSLGSHTAAFLEPFTDTPDEKGFLLDSLEDLRAWISGADAAGLQPIVHAIGDRAIRDLLDIYYEVENERGDENRRFRMEHAQHIHPNDIPRFAIQNVIASMQPYHAIDDGRWAENVIGAERSKTTYAFKSLIDDGAHVAFGSDWYVAPANPLEGIYAAVTRRTLDDENPDGWVAEQKISVEQALRAYTYEGAFASFEEERKGTLKAGMLADMTLIDRDLTAIAAETIRDAKVLKTIVGGRVVFSGQNEEQTASYAEAAELESFCDRLPRPAYADYQKHEASNDWFEVYEVEPDIWAIYEPFQWQEVISYLIVGSESSVLFDTGNGIGDIKSIVDQLTDKPVRALNSHSHFDHIGGNYQFDEILSVATPFSLSKSAGMRSDELGLEVSPEALCKGLPAGVTEQNHRTRPFSISKTIEDREVLNIGGRRLEVLRVPGHTDDAIALLDRDAGFLWSGDSFYEGPIWLFFPETDLVAYQKSVAKMASLAPDLRAVFPAHNTPKADPALLMQLRENLDLVLTGMSEPVPVSDGNVEFQFAGFSFLMRENYHRIPVE
jgi:predicted amidohydrolase YtcJ/glyoxylase-like metal-dependent hydrolase (beta-lactamase superfamily II)